MSAKPAPLPPIAARPRSGLPTGPARAPPSAAAARAARAREAVPVAAVPSRDPGAPPADYIKRSGGIFRDMTIHDFDTARWLLGEEPETVVAQARAPTD